MPPTGRLSRTSSPKPRTTGVSGTNPSGCSWIEGPPSFAPQGRPKARLVGPHAHDKAGSLPSEGEQFAPWGGPSARMKVPVSVLVLVHTHDLQVLLIQRADRSDSWQSVTGSQEPG